MRRVLGTRRRTAAAYARDVVRRRPAADHLAGRPARGPVPRVLRDRRDHRPRGRAHVRQRARGVRAVRPPTGRRGQGRRVPDVPRPVRRRPRDRAAPAAGPRSRVGGLRVPAERVSDGRARHGRRPARGAVRVLARPRAVTSLARTFDRDQTAAGRRRNVSDFSRTRRRFRFRCATRTSFYCSIICRIVL